MGNFGAFFRRSDRENDYLWGRLHAVDRLIDLVYDAAIREGAPPDADLTSLKKWAFELILDREREPLRESAALLQTLRDEVAAL